MHDRFQRMREKYDKVTVSHETHQRELETLNAKMKKLQAENDLLLDAMYLADPSLYRRYFPTTPGSMSPTLPSASVPPFLPPSQPQVAYPQMYFPDTHTPSTPYPSSSHYPSSMPPPGSMPPPPLSSTTSGAPGSALSPMPPPLHSMHSPSMAMPPPSSASTNGTVTGVAGEARHLGGLRMLLPGREGEAIPEAVLGHQRGSRSLPKMLPRRMADALPCVKFLYMSRVGRWM
ncbi:hypothetical protein BJ912DRAFT_445576 [Pholiota molesta]|nr:hypothetical protein BJ912DRAFT_445576 [Pholiota molesta]